MRGVRVTARGWVFSAALFSASMVCAQRPVVPDPVAQPMNRFAVDLLQALPRQNDENLVFSPYSVYSALTALAFGADGDSLELLKTALRLDFAPDQYEARLTRLNAQLSLGRQMAGGNAIWLFTSDRLEAPYVRNVERVLGVAVRSANPATAAEEINRWVQTKTRGRIPKLLDNLDRNSVLAIVNAMVFEGNWQKPFPPPQIMQFFTPGGKSVIVPGLQDSRVMPIATADGGVVAGKLLYAGGTFSLTLAFRRDSEQFVDAEEFERLEGAFRNREAIVAIPKLKMEYEVKLEDPLTKLGLGPLFSHINLSRALPNPDPNLKITTALHRANLEMDSEGTRASAATVIIAGTSGGASSSRPPDPRFRFIVDRPYTFAIRHEPTGVIVFLGRVANPAAAR